MKKILSVLLGLLLLVPALASCSGRQAGHKDAKSKKVINLVLDWYPNALHTFLYTAVQRGYFAEEGLDVHLQYPSNDTDAMTLVAAGKAEIGLFYQHDLIQADANQNIGLKSIGAVVQSPLNIILSLADKNIHRPKDLEGKTVGYAGTLLSEAFVKAMMQADGADYSTVKMVNVGFDLMSSMTTGQVDATIGCLVNHEVPVMEEKGFKVNYFMVNEYGIPNYYEAILMAEKKWIDKDPEAVKGFLRACEKGFRDTKSDPEACLDILMKNQNADNFPLSRDVERKSLAMLLPRMETKDAPFLSQSPEIWQKNIDWMRNFGLIKRELKPSDVMATFNLGDSAKK